jgi:hypothetical protein
MSNHSETRAITMGGNQNGVKIKDPDLRQKAYDKYCEWLAKGKTKKSFTFVEGELMCTWQTIESYVKLYPSEFNSLKQEVAYAQGYAHWESVVDGSAEGSNKDASTASLNMLMRNKYKWDIEEKSKIDHETKSSLQDYSFAMKEGRDAKLPELEANRTESQSHS